MVLNAFIFNQIPCKSIANLQKKTGKHLEYLAYFSSSFRISKFSLIIKKFYAIYFLLCSLKLGVIKVSQSVSNILHSQ